MNTATAAAPTVSGAHEKYRTFLQSVQTVFFLGIMVVLIAIAAQLGSLTMDGAIRVDMPNRVEVSPVSVHWTQQTVTAVATVSSLPTVTVRSA